MLTPLLNSRQTKKIDEFSIQEGFSEMQLMGQAALACLYQMETDHFLPTRSALYFLCGSGNNGGDALSLAWHINQTFFNQAHRPTIYDPSQIKIFSLFSSGKKTKTLASKFYLNQCLKSQMIIHDLNDFLLTEIPPGSLIIDGLLGVGAQGKLKSPYPEILKKIFSLIKNSHCQLIALDVPTGISDEDPPFSPLPIPQKTYSLGVYKLSLALNTQIPPESIHVLPIGFSYSDEFKSSQFQSLSQFPQLFPLEKEARDLTINKKQIDHHKYTAGCGLIIGGSEGMEGALQLSSQSFFATGGGLLYAVFPDQKSHQLLFQDNPSLIYSCLENKPNFNFNFNFKKINAVLLGPGLNKLNLNQKQNLETILLQIKQELDQRTDFYVIADAGFLTHHHHYFKQFSLHGNQVILTPHRGELSHLGFNFHYLSHELPKLQQFVRDYQCSFLVKDAVSLLITPNKPNKMETFLWKQNSPWLAVAGSGDVLGGILLALLARKRNETIPLSQIIYQSLRYHYWAGKILQEQTPPIIAPMAHQLIQGLHQLMPN